MRLNFIPVTFSADEIELGAQQYISSDHLRNLRTTYRASHVLHRVGSEIWDVPLSVDVRPVGQQVKHQLQDGNVGVKLAEEALIRWLRAKGIRIRRFAPLTWFDMNKDLLADAAKQNGLSLTFLFAMRLTWQAELRTLYPKGKRPVSGLCVGAKTSIVPLGSLREFMAAGCGVNGRYLIGWNSVEGPSRLLGRVKTVQADGSVLLDDSVQSSVSVDECTLEPSKENLVAYLQLVLGAKYERLQRTLARLSYDIEGGPGQFRYAEIFEKRLKQIGSVGMAQSVSMTFGSLMLPGEDPLLPMRRADGPTYVFDPSGSRTNNWHDGGLRQYGPFDREYFAIKEPSILLLTPNEYRGQAEVFVRNLLDGLPQTRYDKGLVAKFHLRKAAVTVKAFPNSDGARSYRAALLEALHEKFDLAVVVTHKELDDKRGEGDPYLVSKSILLSHAVPTQEIGQDTLSLQGNSRVFTLNNVALQVYAKMGGVPWLISSNPGIAHEVVFGLGSAIIRRGGRLGGQDRYVGITTVFDSDGNYLLSNTSQEVEYDRYADELLAVLSNVIDEVAKRNGWESGDDVRLIFHVFKPLKDSEARAVAKFVEQLTNYNVQFAFVHIDRGHPFMLLDEEQTGTPFGNSVKGRFVPEKGLMLRLGGRTALLSTIGPRELKTDLQGCPAPILLNLHRMSTFTDLDYLTIQAFRFAGLSWRSFSSSYSPVTISYSQLIARLLGKLRDVRNWNPDVLRTQLTGTRWFL